MSLPIPNLDNKRFDQLVEEARKLIPGYSSEWTDHNLSDPGITLIDLFAWLSEIALYRINLVNDSHRLKYLKLLGVKPQPAKQAKVDLTFTSKIGKTFPKGTKVSTEVNGKEIFFQLEEEINILPTMFGEKILEKIIVDEGMSGVYDRSSSNEKIDLFFTPFGEEIQKDCALYLGFNFWNDDVPDTLSLMCYLYEKGMKEPGKHGAEEDSQFENATLKWEIYNSPSTESSKKDIWKPVHVLDDKTEGFKKSGKIVFDKLGADWRACSLFQELFIKSEQNTKGKYFWLRCRVEESYYEYPPRIANLKLNTVSAIHSLTVENDNLKMESNGLPGQIFKLNETPIVDKILNLLVNEPNHSLIEEWFEVNDFEESGPSDKHFILDRQKEEIRFGNGKKGLIPPEGSIIVVKYLFRDREKEGSIDICEEVSKGLPDQIFKLKRVSISLCEPALILKLLVEEKWIEVDDFEGSGSSDKHFVLDREKGEVKFGDGLRGIVPSQGSVIRVTKYVSGGGKEGNLMPKHKWKIDGFDNPIENELASTGGMETQSIEDAIEDFLRDLSTPFTAVTLADFEYIAQNTPGLRVAKVKAIPSYNPNNPDPVNPEENTESVTVIIVPYTYRENMEKPPEPSEGFRQAVCAHLDKHRLLGTDVHVIPPQYVKVSVNATITPMESFHDDDQIRKKVLEKLNTFLHPIKGGRDGKGWPIGRNIFRSELYDIIKNVDGVNCVLRLSISGDQDVSSDEDGNLLLNKLTSVYSGVHNIKLSDEWIGSKRGDNYSGM